MINKDYKTSMQHWFKSMELSIEQIEKENKYHIDEIDIHNKKIEVNNLQLLHDKKRLADARVDFEKYLTDNQE